MSLQQKKIPERRCVGCGERFPKPTLVRVVRSKDGVVSLDRTGKASGRGTYICPNVECLRRARKARRLETNLECTVPPEIYEILEGEIQKGADEK